MTLPSKLSSQGLILVLVPLLVQLVCMWWLFQQLSDVETEVKRAQHSKQISDATNALIAQIYEIVGNLYGGTDSDNASFIESNFIETTRKMRNELDTLEILCKDDPHESAIVAGVDRQGTECLHFLRRSLDLMHQGQMTPKSELRQRTFKLLRQYVKGMLPEEFINMNKQERMIVEESPERQAKAREQVRYGLLILIVLDVLVAVGCTLFYMKRIVTRLSKMQENSLRLASNKPLHPPLSGDDEISNLDAVFHSMAEALGEANRKERAVVENARDVICSLDGKGTFIAVSPASSSVFGYEPDELIGSKMINLIAPEDVQNVLNTLKVVMEGGNEPPFEARLVRKDETIIDVRWSAHWSDQEETSFCIVHDITERKQAERLRQEVMQMVSHDLKTPLSAVRSFLDMLETGMFGELSERGQRLLQLADRSTAQMLTLVKDLLDIERMEAGMLDLFKKDVPVSSLLDQTVNSCSVGASERGVRIYAEPTTLTIFADADRLVQVLINLTTNSVKFSPRGSTVTLAARDDGEMIEISVTDHGRGIPEHMLKNIFERFKQVRQSDTSEKGGSGLGLAICKALVELHGGNLSVVSEENQGSTFSFRIPKQAKTKAAEAAVPESPRETRS